MKVSLPILLQGERKIFNGFSYAISLRSFALLAHRNTCNTLWEHFQVEFTLSQRGREWERREVLCFIKTLKGIYAGAFLSFSKDVVRCQNCLRKFFSSGELQNEDIHEQKMPFVSRKHYVMIVFYILSHRFSSALAVKKPGKFMWNRKQLLLYLILPVLLLAAL